MTEQNISNKVDQVADNAYVKLISRLGLPAMALVGLQVWDGLKEQGKDITTLVAGQMVLASQMQDTNRRIENIERVQNPLLFGKPSPGNP
jgi:hypothetical protein